MVQRSPISSIPNEVLSRIFCILRDTSAPGRGTLKAWFGVSHVCHLWREVALGTSLLWCHIYVSRSFRSWIPELLRRSKQSPLTMVIEGHDCGLLEEARKHFGRVRELVLDCDHGSQLLEQIFSPGIDFQRLEMIHIISDDLSPFMLNYSRLRTENLTHLTLESCTIDWDRISRINPRAELHRIQHLQKLSLKGESPEIAHVLSGLVVPPSCKLHIHLRTPSYISRDHDFRAVLSWVSNQLCIPTTPSPTSTTRNHAQLEHIRSLRIEYLVMGFNVEGFCDDLSHGQSTTTEPVLKFDVSWRFGFGPGVGLVYLNLQMFISSLPLGGVGFLSLVFFSPDPPPEFWWVVSGSMPSLDTIHLDITTSAFWEALTATDGKTVQFSALASVTVSDHFLDSELVLDALRARRSQRDVTQLQRLRFSAEGEVPPSFIIAQLEELVSDIQVVDWV